MNQIEEAIEAFEAEEGRNIYQRVNEIRKEVAYIKKDAKVQNYKAVTHDAVIAQIRGPMLDQGVMVVPKLVSSNVAETGTATSSGTPIIRYEAFFDVHFVNIDNPEDFISVPIEAHANDSGDKAPGKAISYATKYAQLKLFNIETGENDESRVEGKSTKHALAEEHQGFIDKVKDLASSGELHALSELWHSLDSSVTDELHRGAPKNPREWGPFEHKVKEALKAADTEHWNACKSFASEIEGMGDISEIQEAFSEMSDLEKQRTWNVLPDHTKQFINEEKAA